MMEIISVEQTKSRDQTIAQEWFLPVGSMVLRDGFISKYSVVASSALVPAFALVPLPSRALSARIRVTRRLASATPLRQSRVRRCLATRHRPRRPVPQLPLLPTTPCRRTSGGTSGRVVLLFRRSQVRCNKVKTHACSGSMNHAGIMEGGREGGVGGGGEDEEGRREGGGVFA